MRRLHTADEGTHAIGPEPNWNESRYLDVHDSTSGVGAWMRIGNRPNEGRAEMSVCVYLPDGRLAFFFDRPTITGNEMSAGAQSWEVVEPFRTSRTTYDGEVMLLDDAWALTDPGPVYRSAPRTECSIDLTSHSFGLDSVMGSDQSHIDRIFLPGQADWHYQHLARTAGTIRVGEEMFELNGRGGKDHSWGPRNWHAKIYLRWLVAMADDDLGFMLVRAVGPTKRTRSGFVWHDGTFHLVDDFEMHNRYASGPNHELRQTDVTIRSGTRTWRAHGEPVAWLPLRHRQRDEAGRDATLRIVKAPTDWVIDGRGAEGVTEYHDRMVDGRPVGLDD